MYGAEITIPRTHINIHVSLASIIKLLLFQFELQLLIFLWKTHIHLRTLRKRSEDSLNSTLWPTWGYKRPQGKSQRGHSLDLSALGDLSCTVICWRQSLQSLRCFKLFYPLPWLISASSKKGRQVGKYARSTCLLSPELEKRRMCQ